MSASIESALCLAPGQAGRQTLVLHFRNDSSHHLAAKFQTNSLGFLQISPTAAVVSPHNQQVVHVMVNPISDPAKVRNLAVRTVYTTLTDEEAAHYIPLFANKKERANCRATLFNDRPTESLLTHIKYKDDPEPEAEPETSDSGLKTAEEQMRTASEVPSSRSDSIVSVQTPPGKPGHTILEPPIDPEMLPLINVPEAKSPFAQISSVMERGREPSGHSLLTLTQDARDAAQRKEERVCRETCAKPCPSQCAKPCPQARPMSCPPGKKRISIRIPALWLVLLLMGAALTGKYAL